MSDLKKLFVAATRQNDGKTSVSLGLFNAFQKRFNKIGYIKPVGQQYLDINGERIDKDAVLFSKVYDIKDNLKDMSPVAVPRGFTETYIDDAHPEIIHNRITDHFKSVSAEKEFMLIEGTGHAGVGSVFNTANADVAKLLGSKVVLVSPGGIGRAIDEVMLNKACFDRLGAEVIGVIVNKVKQDKYDKIQGYVKRGFERLGVPFLGAIPYVRMLSSPSMKELAEALNAELLSGADRLNNKAEKVLIGAMASHDAIDYFDKNTVMIVPGNREAVILTALFNNILEMEADFNISGMIFTGGIKPHDRIFDLIKHAKIPFLLVPEDSYTVATKVNNMIVKLRSYETDKISMIQNLVEEHVDIDYIVDNL